MTVIDSFPQMIFVKEHQNLYYEWLDYILGKIFLREN